MVDNFPSCPACPTCDRAEPINLTEQTLSDDRHTISSGLSCSRPQHVVASRKTEPTPRRLRSRSPSLSPLHGRTKMGTKLSWIFVSLVGLVSIQAFAVAAITAVVVLSEGNVLGIVIALVLVSATLSTSMWSWCRFCETRLREAEWRNYTREKK